MDIRSINPATGQLIKSYDIMGSTTIDHLVAEAKSKQHEWQALNPAQRSEIIIKIGEQIVNQLDDHAQLMTQEMGKPITQAREELKKCALLCDYYATQLDTFLQPTQPDPSVNGFYVPVPIGNILAIMPWNFPFWQVIRAAIPNLALGNGILLKPAPNVMGCALALKKIIHTVSPQIPFDVLMIDEAQTGALIDHPDIMGVTLTGSQRAGRSVAALAGKALKPVTLELGGNDPYLILADADLDEAAETLVNNRFMNAGQVCVSPKRIIVVDEVYHAFESRVLSLVNAYQPSDPSEDHCKLGPMAREDLRTHFHQQIQTSVLEGAKCLTGGHMIPGPGYYYAPTVLSGITATMTPFNEELFGPVINLIAASDEKHAIELANHGHFGLGGGVFSRDTTKALDIVQNKLQIGIGSINASVRSNPRLPFGGIHGSGYGRECGYPGFLAFANIKSINL